MSLPNSEATSERFAQISELKVKPADLRMPTTIHVWSRRTKVSPTSSRSRFLAAASSWAVRPRASSWATPSPSTACTSGAAGRPPEPSAGASCTPASENQLPPGRSSRLWTRAVNRGSSMPRSCRKRRFGRPSEAFGDRLVGHQEGFAAGHRAAVLADHVGQVLDVRQVADGEIADDFVGGAVGQHQHVARLAGLLRQFASCR